MIVVYGKQQLQARLFGGDNYDSKRVGLFIEGHSDVARCPQSR